ncbi:MAG: hypothetical protein Q7J09_01430 [Methanocalculus sp.]|uniref:hypothetical protein n=1 Tax=Methanocalculus sp. TaxID=2004547 RepID=UPI00271703A3|nr:hypothetical protein [Methanocalculus sp.]MDO9538654.1 hypothetical protein [Methanocalculus sp.]
MYETWLCPHCENIFVVLQSCAACGPGCNDTAVCPRCGETLRRPVRMTFFSGLEDE